MYYARSVTVNEGGGVSFGPFSLVELTKMSIVPGVPGKPQPPGGGTEPPLGIWGPTDPRPTHPIAGWNPGTGNFPELPGGVPEVPEGVKVVGVKRAEEQPPVPEGLPPDSVYLEVSWGQGGKGAAWGLPYAAPVK
ncbi:MAG: hypothetical protein ACHQX3_06235 [Nitrospirales bacterium]